MECVKESEASFFTSYKKSSVLEVDEELYREVTFTFGGVKYRVFTTKQRATRATHVHCRGNGTVYFEEHTDEGSEERAIVRPGWDMDEICVVVISGKPGEITGLDEGIFVSSSHTGRVDGRVFVMTEMRFKLFSGVGA